MSTDIVTSTGIKVGTSEVLSGIHQVKGIITKGNLPGEVFLPSTGMGYYINSSTAVALTTGTLFYFPLYVSSDCLCDLIHIRTSVGSAGNINMGIYNSSQGQPTGSPLTGSTSGSLSTAASTTNLRFTFTNPIALKAGNLYWLAATTDTSTPTFVSCSVTFAAFHTSIGQSVVSGTNNTIYSWTQAFVYSTTLPAAASLTEVSAAAATCPVMAVRVFI